MNNDTSEKIINGNINFQNKKRNLKDFIHHINVIDKKL